MHDRARRQRAVESHSHEPVPDTRNGTDDRFVLPALQLDVDTPPVDDDRPAVTLDARQGFPPMGPTASQTARRRSAVQPPYDERQGSARSRST
jgi:hypothetical protein